LPLVLEVKDGDFSKGTCGLGTDKNSDGVYFTNIEVH